MGLSTAWWCNGHMITAMIAQLDLQASAPNVLETANQVLAPLNGPLTYGLSDTFVETACWADDIKDMGSLLLMSDWHYINKPYNIDGLLNATGEEVYNILYGIEQALDVLRYPDLTQAPLETSLMLRFLIHFVGDLHQPLHATQMFSNAFTSGDLGGNLFPIEFSSDVNNLHKLWDWGMGIIGTDCQRPLSKDGWKEITDYAKIIMLEHSRKDLEQYLEDTRLADWVQFSYDNAVENSYGDIELGGKPSKDYKERGRKIVKRQLALAGYRLSDLLKEVWNTPKK